MLNLLHCCFVFRLDSGTTPTLTLRAEKALITHSRFRPNTTSDVTTLPAVPQCQREGSER
jgi:hypothetical protein